MDKGKRTTNIQKKQKAQTKCGGTKTKHKTNNKRIFGHVLLFLISEAFWCILLLFNGTHKTK